MHTHGKTRRADPDLLHGSLWDKILKFAIPLALTGILQQLFNAADIAVVGQCVGGNAMAAVGANSPVIGLSTSLFIGISMGANVVISLNIGQGHQKAINRAVHTALLTALISGVIVTALGECFAPALLRAMSVPDEVLDMAVLYLRVYMAGMPLILLYNFSGAIFRSMGDTRTPLVALMISGILNVALNLLFVLGFGMTVEGVALATAISSGVSALILLWQLHRRDDALMFRVRRLAIDGRLLLNMLRIGLPAGLQGAVFSFSNLLIQSAINSLGPAIMAGSSAAFNVEILAYYIVNAFGQATTTFVGQNYGAGQTERCRRVTRISFGMGLAASALIALVLVPFAGQILKLFNPDPVIVLNGVLRVRFIVLAEGLSCAMEVLSGSMRAYQYSLVPALITLVGVCGSRITWVYTVFRQSPTFRTLLAVYPLSWAITAACLWLAYYLVLRHMRRKAQL